MVKGILLTHSLTTMHTKLVYHNHHTILPCSKLTVPVEVACPPLFPPFSKDFLFSHCLLWFRSRSSACVLRSVGPPKNSFGHDKGSWWEILWAKANDLLASAILSRASEFRNLRPCLDVEVIRRQIMLHMMASESLARISGNGYNVKFLRGNFYFYFPYHF